jgi:S1-C subfamily serine protease
MNAFRNTLLAACLAVGALPGWAAAAETPPPANNADVEKQLEEARKQLAEAARRVGELSGQLGQRYVFQFGGPPGAGGPPPRALLGVSIDSDDDAKGARVREVSPGSAAAEAGIKAGDVITSIAGQDLTKEDDAGRALVDKMRQIEPNLKLQVGVLRDGKKLSFDVTPRPAPPAMLGQIRPGVAPFTGGRMLDLPPALAARRFELHREEEDGTRFRGSEFATLSERLGSYFGVKSGVLVVRAGADSPFKLQDGDVILAIDGREPSSAQHAGRILRSYRAGEKLTLRVQRDRKAQNIEVTVPRGDRDDEREDD